MYINLLNFIIIFLFFVGCKKKEVEAPPPPPPPPPPLEVKPPEYPVYNYVAADRRDPFVPLIKKPKEKKVEKKEELPTEPKERLPGEVDIEYFELVGIVWDKSIGGTALFKDGPSRYILRGKTLYGDNYMRIAGVRGRVYPTKAVLTQGKKRRTFLLVQKPILLAGRVKRVEREEKPLELSSDIVDIKIKDKKATVIQTPQEEQ